MAEPYCPPATVVTPEYRDRWQRWVLSWFPYAVHACFALAVFLTPVAVYYGAPDAIQLPKLTAMWILTICAAGLTLMARVEGQKLSIRSPITVAMIGFMAALAVATALSDLPRVSVIGLQKRYSGFVPQLLYAFMMLFVFATYRQRLNLLRQIAWACAAGSSLMSLYLLVQAVGWDWAVWVVNGVAPEFPGSTLGNSNFAGGYLAIALPLSLYLAITSRGWRVRALVGSLSAVQLLALWCTHTRGGLLALLVSVLVTVFIARSWLPGWTSKVAVGAAAVLVACVLLILWHPGMSRPPGPLAEVRTSTFENRLAYWQSGWNIFRDNPVVGTGLDTFYAFYGRYQRPEQAAKEPLTTIEEPHNILVERATSSGVLGLGSYVLVVALVLRSAISRLQRVASPQRWLLLGFLGSLVAYLVQGFFSIDVPPLAFMGWIALGALAALGDPEGMLASPEDAAVGPPIANASLGRWLAHGVVVVGAVGLLVLGTRPLRADVGVSKGRLEEAMKLQPLEARYRAYAGDRARAMASTANNPAQAAEHLREADSFYREALRRQPDDLNFLVALATLNSQWADTLDPSRSQMAELWWRRALAVYPLDPELQIHYAQAVQESTRRG